MRVGDKVYGFKFKDEDYPTIGYTKEMDLVINKIGIITEISFGATEIEFEFGKASWSYPTELVKNNLLSQFWKSDKPLQHKKIGCKPLEYIHKKDKIVKQVIKRFKQRSEVGIKKYNTTLERNDLSTLEWLTHLQEEMMDATLYIERLKQEYDTTANR